MPIINAMPIRQELDAVKTEMRGICDAALASDTKTMDDKGAAKYSELEGRAKTLSSQIELAERNNALEIDDVKTRDDGGSASDGTGGLPSKEKRFASFGENLHAIIRSYGPNGMRDERLSGMESRAQGGMGEDTGSGGGYLVQTDFVAELMKKIYSTGGLASRCRKIGIGAQSNGLSWNEIDESARTDGYRWGGGRAYWVAAGTAVTGSTLKTHRRKLDLEKLMAIVRVTDELMTDSTALGNLVSDIISQELSYKLDDAIIRGTGAGMPLGWLNSDCVVSVDKQSGQAADTIHFENLVKMRARLWAASRPNAIWVINQDIEPELHTMAYQVGTGGVPVYMPAAGVSGAPYDTLYGRPVVAVEQASTLGDLGDINLVDLSQYLLIDKGGIKRDVSIHVYFTTDEQALRFVLRVNGMPLWSSALTPANGSNTLSPFVTLAERA